MNAERPRPGIGWIMVCLLGLAMLGSTAAAEESEATKDATAATRVEVLPRVVTRVEREVRLPAQVKRLCTPIYETLTIPVFTAREVPQYEVRDVPTYAWRTVPVYHSICQPTWRSCQVPIYQEIRTPVTTTVWRPRCCDCENVTLFERCERVAIDSQAHTVQRGVQRFERPGGMRRERYRTGTEKKRVHVGYRTVVEQSSVRSERRLVGYKTREVELAPARVEIVVAEITLPERRITVVKEAQQAAVRLPGTTEILTETEFQAVRACRGEDK